MTLVNKSHLNKEEIIRAVVDENDLSDTLREHLSSCDLCRSEKERLENQLSRLGSMAKRLSPSPGPGIILPEQKERWPTLFQRWHWRSLVAACMTAAIIMAVAWWKIPGTTSPDGINDELSLEIVKDEQLINEISWLEEHALPQVYFDISGESDLNISEEFMEFLISPIQTETIFQLKIKEEYYVA